MKKNYIYAILIALLTLASVMPVRAAGDDIYYVRLDHTGCEDGSQECPFNTLNKAITAGHEQVCEGRSFEVHVWNEETEEYEYHDTYSGRKPIPPTGLPIAPSLVIILIAFGGILSLALALYTRGKVRR